jgi:hypothetical protein
MKKVEMEAHRDAYRDLMSRARSAVGDGSYRTAVELALSAWDHIDGMMQYERKYESVDFRSIEAIDIVLKYAPLLLDFKTLDTLDSLLKERRRIEKNTSDSLGDNLGDARSLMWDAHRLWDYLEFHPDARQDELREHLGGDQNRWRSVANTWAAMGLVRRMAEGRSYRLSLSTRMGEVVPAKCPSCGTVTHGPKAMFLEELACPDCERIVSFVLLACEITKGHTE